MKHEMVINGKKTIVLIPETDLEREFLKGVTSVSAESSTKDQILGRTIPEGSLIIRDASHDKAKPEGS
jgi:hypothetical protein